MIGRQSVSALALMAIAISPAGAAPREIVTDLVEIKRAAKAGDSLWPGFTKAPFGFLLVEKDRETLLCDTRVPDGFRAEPSDTMLGCATAIGPSSWRQPSLLAAMPVFGPGEVIVMGTPEATGLDRDAWRRTVLHEHFHQWQGQLPDIYARLDALGLAKGDKTGMWMLNYPFPYDKPEVDGAFRAAADALLAALAAPPAELAAKGRAYLTERAAFQASVSDEQWRYFDFQLWKEGVARWTEMEVARRAGGRWMSRADRDWSKLLDDLKGAQLAEKQRVAVYSYGAAEAALLERIDTDWRDCYRAVTTMSPCWDSLALH